MVLFPGTKINLGLHITERRPDGFHHIETIFYPLSYSDILEVVPSGEFNFEVSGLPIPGKASENLVVKAWDLMRRSYGAGPVNVRLHKVVPPGSGLGGGSADAAAMVRVLNTLFKLELPDKELQQAASLLGSDCAFFINARPSLATGRGEVLTSFDFSLEGYAIALVLPDIPVSTAEAYRQCHPAERDVSLREIVQMPVDQWRGRLVNDFERLPLIPAEIHDIKQQLYDAGALYAAMSGSGSAVFGIFEEKTALDSLQNGKLIWVPA